MSKQKEALGISSIVICILYSALILFGHYIEANSIILIANLFILICIICDSYNNKILYLIYLISWADILKTNPGQLSFYTILLLAYVFICFYRYISKKEKIYVKGLIGYIALLAYTLISACYSKPLNMTLILSFLLNYLLIYLIVTEYRVIYYTKYIYAYTCGLFTASLAGMCYDFIPKLARFIKYDTLIHGGNILNRFTGLNEDPNYYGLQILICVTMLLVKYVYNNNNKDIVIVLIMSGFGFLSFSKMYLILFTLVFISFLLIQSKQNIIKLLKIVGVIIGVSIIVFFCVGRDFIEIYINRLSLGGAQININSLTTGRFNIWGQYIDYIMNSIQTLLVGMGISTTPLFGGAAHNVYITSIYTFGVMGSLILIVYILLINKAASLKSYKNNRKIVNYLPMCILLIAELSLDGLLYDLLPVLIALVIIALHYNENKKINMGDDT